MMELLRSAKRGHPCAQTRTAVSPTVKITIFLDRRAAHSEESMPSFRRPTGAQGVHLESDYQSKK